MPGWGSDTQGAESSVNPRVAGLLRRQWHYSNPGWEGCQGSPPFGFIPRMPVTSLNVTTPFPSKTSSCSGPVPVFLQNCDILIPGGEGKKGYNRACQKILPPRISQKSRAEIAGINLRNGNSNGYFWWKHGMQQLLSVPEDRIGRNHLRHSWEVVGSFIRAEGLDGIELVLGGSRESADTRRSGENSPPPDMARVDTPLEGSTVDLCRRRSHPNHGALWRCDTRATHGTVLPKPQSRSLVPGRLCRYPCKPVRTGGDRNSTRPVQPARDYICRCIVCQCARFPVPGRGTTGHPCLREPLVSWSHLPYSWRCGVFHRPPELR